MGLIPPNSIAPFRPRRTFPKDEHPALYDAWQSGPYVWCERCGVLMEEGMKHIHSDAGMLAKAFLTLSEYTGMRYDPKLISTYYR